VIAGTVADLARRAAEAGVGGPALLIVGDAAAAAAMAPRSSVKAPAESIARRAELPRGRRRAAA
jgi:siroheme synthase